MAIFTKNQTPQPILNRAIRGFKTVSGVFGQGVPTSGRLNSVEFDQRRIIPGSGLKVETADQNAISLYDDAGLYGLSDYYPISVLATGTLQVQTTNYQQLGVVSVVSPDGELFLELPPDPFSNIPKNNVATALIDGVTNTSGTYGLYIGLNGRSSSSYNCEIQVLGSTAGGAGDQISNVGITGPSTVISGVANSYTLSADGATIDGYNWSTPSANAVISASGSSTTNITFVTPGSTTVSGVVSASAATVTNSPQSEQTSVQVNNPAFGAAAVSGPTEVASGVANTYTLQLDMGTVPAGTVSYSWATTDGSAVIGSPAASGTTITFSTSGTFDVYGTATSASADPTAVSGTVQPVASGFIPPSINFGTVTVTGPASIASGVDQNFSATYDGNLPGALANYSWSTTGSSVVTSGTAQTATIRFNDSGNQTVTAELTSNFAEDSPVTGSAAVSVTQPATYTSFAVTVQYYSDYYTSGNKYYIDGSRQATVALTEGQTYRFDQSDSSNNNHPLRFSTTPNGTHSGGTEYLTGVVKNGVPGQADAYTEITVAAGAPTLYYYCQHHSNMGGTATT